MPRVSSLALVRKVKRLSPSPHWRDRWLLEDQGNSASISSKSARSDHKHLPSYVRSAGDGIATGKSVTMAGVTSWRWAMRWAMGFRALAPATVRPFPPTTAGSILKPVWSTYIPTYTSTDAFEPLQLMGQDASPMDGLKNRISSQSFQNTFTRESSGLPPGTSETPRHLGSADGTWPPTGTFSVHRT